jgi:hypothetical protein
MPIGEPLVSCIAFAVPVPATHEPTPTAIALSMTQRHSVIVDTKRGERD